MTDINPKDYHYDEDDIKTRAIDNLKHHKPYQKLVAEFERLDPRIDFVKRNFVKTKMRQIESEEIYRLVELEDKRRQDVNTIDDMLRNLNPEDYHRYQQLMAGLAMSIDMLDHTFSSINGLLYRNGIGVMMHQFPEITAAKEMLSNLADMEVANMPEYKAKEYVAESDRLWQHLQERCAIYVRKIDRIEANMEK